MACIVCGIDTETEYYCTKGDITVCMCEQHMSEQEYDSVMVKQAIPCC